MEMPVAEWKRIIGGEGDREGMTVMGNFRCRRCSVQFSGRGLMLVSAAFGAVEVHEQTDRRLVLGACLVDG